MTLDAWSKDEMRRAFDGFPTGMRLKSRNKCAGKELFLFGMYSLVEPGK